MKKKYSIKRRNHFKYVFDNGNQITGKILRIFFLGNKLNYNRLAVTTNRKIANMPLKNRAKRLIRESYRKVNIKNGYDIIILWKLNNVHFKQEIALKDLKDILKKADLIDEKTSNNAN